jgi:hypothetical protein
MRIPVMTFQRAARLVELGSEGCCGHRTDDGIWSHQGRAFTVGVFEDEEASL